MRRSTILAPLFIMLGLVAVACGAGGDGPSEIASQDSEQDRLANTSTQLSQQASTSDGSSTWLEDDYRSAYFQLFGGEAVLEAHHPEALGELEIPELRGLTHTLTEIDVDRVAYLRDMEEDGIVEVPAITPGPLTVFEVFSNGPSADELSIFFALGDEPFLAVLDYESSSTQADATGGWHAAVVATADEAGELSFHGTLGPVAAEFFDEARRQFVPSRYESDQALLVAIVSEAAESFLGGEPGKLGTAVIEALF